MEKRGRERRSQGWETRRHPKEKAGSYSGMAAEGAPQPAGGESGRKV